MKKIDLLKAIAIPLLIFCFVFTPSYQNISPKNIAIANSEEYPGEIDEDTTWGAEHATVDYDVIVYEGATLTLQQGNYDFKGSLDIYAGANLVLSGGEYFFEKSIFSDGASIILRKGNYIFGEDFYLNNHSKLNIEAGTNIKFKKTGDYTPGMQLAESTIIAEGTIDEMITFEGADENSDGYSISIGGYDNNEISSFKYVNFIGGGQAWESGQAMLRNIFINTAYAAEGIDGKATLDIYDGNVSIEHAKFDGNNYYAINYAWYVDINDTHKALRVVDSDFLDNTYKLAVKSDMRCQYEDKSLCSTAVTLKNNYYNSVDGPKSEGNPPGTGNEVTGFVNLDGYNTQSNFTPIVSDGPSNVLFLPGLEGSRLYNKDDKKIWEPEDNWDISDLYLKSDGNSVNNIHTKNGEVIYDFMESFALYDSFIKKLGSLDSEAKISGWSTYAYDWRMPLDKILEDGSLENKLREMAKNSDSKKVTIVAHSNGGLLTKALLQKLGNEETKKLVDKVILVAVPQVGTPSAVSAMLHGYKQHILPFMTNGEARNLAVNMSSAYNLLPSEAYFTTVYTKVITFDEDKCSEDWKNRYGGEINDKEALDNFLTDDFRRSLMLGTTLDVPMELNRTLLEKANAQHKSLDDWSAPEGVKVIQIAGWGVPATISGVKYKSENGELCNSVCQYGLDVLDPSFNSTIDGDGTVVTPSALWMNNGAERYWVNINKYNDENKISTAYGIIGPKHSDILEISELSSFIADKIIDNTKSLSEYEYLSAEVPPYKDEKRLQYTLHSPLTLDLYDDQERHTGINEEGYIGYIEEEIPGTYYREIGETKNIFTSDEFDGHIEMKGYDTGKFTFSVKEYQDDVETGEVTFKDIPTTPETVVHFSAPDGLENASNLEIDKDGDEDIDYSLEPKIGEDVTLDVTAPVTEAIFSGSNGENGWYISDTTLTFNAGDEEKGSGLQKTEYSTDNGNTWTTYENPIVFSQEGMMDIQYRSQDKQGNVEETKTVTIKIDKTAPEAKIFFDKDDKKLYIIGFDNLSKNVVVTTEEKIIKIPKDRRNMWSWGWLWKNDDRKIVETATLMDEAGHKTEIELEKKKDKNGFIDASVQSVSYDGQETKLDNNGLQYKWVLNWWKNKYLVFASHMRTSTLIWESHYLPKLNQTWIMEWPRDLPDDENDDISRRPVRKKMPGMVIPGIITNKGDLQVIY